MPSRISRWLVRGTIYSFVALLVFVFGISSITTTLCGCGPHDDAKGFTLEIDIPLQVYQKDTGSYPTTAQGLQALIIAPPGATNWHGPYIKEVPNDHWGHPYHYLSPGLHNPKSYDVWSSGPDGKDGTDDDISNWESPRPHVTSPLIQGY